ncbi:MAG: 50S ribosomal protein L10 [Clostridium sp.]|nr:50S ribosomal protein L10 [Clostridium sp.]MCM1444054.1 50S ribosomal protein L10 [Candidatus Amulumruptor caecigallinarius]
MANVKILEKKQTIIDEISDKIKNSSSVVFFEYQGLTVKETDELRKKLRESESDFKVYKNTLTMRALDSLKIDLGFLEGPRAIAFGNDTITSIKVLSDFAKKHPALQLKAGIVDGNIADIDMLNKLASIPSRDTLLTMIAAGLMENVKKLAICLDLHSQNLEN